MTRGPTQHALHRHLALVPAEPFRLLPFVALLAVALSLVGAFAFSRRDIR